MHTEEVRETFKLVWPVHGKKHIEVLNGANTVIATLNADATMRRFFEGATTIKVKGSFDEETRRLGIARKIKK